MPPRKSSGSPYARSICRFGDHVIEQENPGDPWYDSTSMLGGYLNRECPGAPNPDEGPMPGHEPGVIAVNPSRKDEQEPAP